MPHHFKKGNLTDLNNGQFAPGQNHFSVLSNYDEPLLKKARSSMPKDLVKMNKVMDTDNQMEDLTSSRQVQGHPKLKQSQ